MHAFSFFETLYNIVVQRNLVESEKFMSVELLNIKALASIRKLDIPQMLELAQKLVVHCVNGEADWQCYWTSTSVMFYCKFWT